MDGVPPYPNIPMQDIFGNALKNGRGKGKKGGLGMFIGVLVLLFVFGRTGNMLFSVVMAFLSVGVITGLLEVYRK